MVGFCCVFLTDFLTEGGFFTELFSGEASCNFWVGGFVFVREFSLIVSSFILL